MSRLGEWETLESTIIKGDLYKCIFLFTRWSVTRGRTDLNIVCVVGVFDLRASGCTVVCVYDLLVQIVTFHRWA